MFKALMNELLPLVIFMENTFMRVVLLFCKRFKYLLVQIKMSSFHWLKWNIYSAIFSKITFLSIRIQANVASNERKDIYFSSIKKKKLKLLILKILQVIMTSNNKNNRIMQLLILILSKKHIRNHFKVF